MKGNELSSRQIEFKYRPDIDGLRAIAVGVVLLYHAGIYMEGGYVGVDVFFVISGFLITSLILREQSNGSFCLKQFWLRRIRRIIPAATVLVIATIIVGYILLLPDDFVDLGKSAIAQQLMASNVYFWKASGYFEGQSELKPLLHTWSLSVEEQFYLGYPLLLIALRRLSHTKLALALWVVLLGSFVVSIWGTTYYPTASFYLLPTRAWELLLGAVLVFMPRPKRESTLVMNLMSLLGLGTILGVALLYSAATPFPGLAAVLPCVGAAFVIYSNCKSTTLVGKLLSSKLFVGIGLISYSLYLWHWPALVFVEYWFGNTSVFVRISILFVSLFLAYLSYHFVEIPFRKAKSIRSHVLFSGAAGSLAFLVAVSGAIWLADGFPARFSPSVRVLLRDNEIEREYESDVSAATARMLPCVGQDRSKTDFLVWGDSHAVALAPLFDDMSREHGITGRIAAKSGTPPILGTWTDFASKEECLEWNEAVIALIEEERVKNVILVARWAAYVEGMYEDPNPQVLLLRDNKSSVTKLIDSQFVMRTRMGETIEKLREMGVKIWVLGQVPFQFSNPRRELIRAEILGLKSPIGTTKDQHRSRQRNVVLILERLEGFDFIDLATHCFDENGVSRLRDVEGCFYFDDDHLSPHGARMLLEKPIRAMFSEF